jgi:hypothetical protein
MAIFTHGTPHSLTLGSERGDQGSITQGQSRSISAQLSALLKPGARLNVYD